MLCFWEILFSISPAFNHSFIHSVIVCLSYNHDTRIYSSVKFRSSQWKTHWKCAFGEEIKKIGSKCDTLIEIIKCFDLLFFVTCEFGTTLAAENMRFHIYHAPFLSVVCFFFLFSDKRKCFTLSGEQSYMSECNVSLQMTFKNSLYTLFLNSFHMCLICFHCDRYYLHLCCTPKMAWNIVMR